MQPAASGVGAPSPAGTSGVSIAGATGSSAGAAGSLLTPALAGRAAPVATAGVGGGSAGAGAAGSGGVAGAPEAGAGAAGAVATAGAGAGGSAGGAGDLQPMAAGFPKTDDVNVAAKGPYVVMTYTMGLDDPEYSSSMMYYPEGAQPPFAVVAFAPGWTAVKENYTFLGFMLASHGIAALLTTPTDTDADQPAARGEDLVAAVARITSCRDRPRPRLRPRRRCNIGSAPESHQCPRAPWPTVIRD